MDRALRIATIATLLLAGGGMPLSASEHLAERAAEALARREAFVEGSDGWRFLPAEMVFASKLASPDLSRQVGPAVEAIADFAAQLRAAEVDLVVVPVPPKVLQAGSAAGVSPEEEAMLRRGWESILEELKNREVAVIDLLPDFAQAADEPFCRRDTHWSGPGIELAVERLRPVLESAGVEVSLPRRPSAWSRQTIKGDLGGEPEEVKLRFSESDEGGAPGPVLLLGDSHVLVFHEGGDLHATGAGLPDRLAAVLGVTPEVIGVRGSGATSARLQLARRTRVNAEYLPSKKMAVWVFAGREFTEADGWKRIPLRRSTGS